MKKLLSAALAICLVLSLSVPASAAQNSLDNFQKTAEYTRRLHRRARVVLGGAVGQDLL